MKDLRKLLGRRLIEILAAKRMKQCELAELMNLDPQSVSRMVSGKHFPKVEHLEKIIEVLKIEPEDLFTLTHVEDDNKLIADIVRLVSCASSEDIRKVHKVVTALLG